ncbi:MAG TPA: hypothetical protein EYQ02_03625, partial [Microbacterium sp.]|nr:hypothetical protein [Microbacterium sp.]
AGFDEPIPFEAIRESVADSLESSPAPQAFLAGGVTFCELVPLRAIPFRVVVILGMSDQAFPRGRAAAGFDLMARAPRPGDRSTRSDDRYLFLEAMLSARDRLILTVPGRDVRDGSDLPPSIVITELLDAIEGSFELESSVDEAGWAENPPATLRASIVVHHALQSFSDRYFEVPGDPRLLGRDEEAYAGALARRRAAEAGGGIRRRFLADLWNGDPVSDPEPGQPVLVLDDLAERVLRSTRYFTREQLRLRLPRSEEVANDLDPVEFEGLEQYSLGSALLEDLDAGVTSEEATMRLLARATIPAGRPGELAVRALVEEVNEVAIRVRERSPGSRLDDLECGIELEVEGLGSCR